MYSPKAGLFILEPMPRIYIDDVRREPYDGIWNDGTNDDKSEMSRRPSAVVSADVNMFDAIGCLRNTKLSLGCDTTTTSSRLNILEESARLNSDVVDLFTASLLKKNGAADADICVSMQLYNNVVILL